MDHFCRNRDELGNGEEYFIEGRIDKFWIQKWQFDTLNQALYFLQHMNSQLKEDFDEFRIVRVEYRSVHHEKSS